MAVLALFVSDAQQAGLQSCDGPRRRRDPGRASAECRGRGIREECACGDKIPTDPGRDGRKRPRTVRQLNPTPF